VVTDEPCSMCEACVEACREDAIFLGPEKDGTAIDMDRCLKCGKCMPVCPTGTLVEGQKGYRVQLGGKLGRHPQLAKALPGIYDENTAMEIVRDCLHIYKNRSKNGERFGQILTPADFEAFATQYQNKSR